MMRSLFSGVAGLKTHQTKMDVIGNNIANVNTVAFKSSATTFADIMYQTTQQASGATDNRGGTNAKQIGLGVTNGATKISITSAGAAQSTGDALDIRLTDANSTNFFIVSNGNENVFTRAGSFYIDGMGNLAMTTTGYLVMGWQVDPANPGEVIKDTVSALRVMRTENLTSAPEATTLANFAGVIDKNDSQFSSSTGYVRTYTFYDNLGYSYNAKFAIKRLNGTEGRYSVELTNVYDQDNKDILAEYISEYVAKAKEAAETATPPVAWTDEMERTAKAEAMATIFGASLTDTQEYKTISTSYELTKTGTQGAETIKLHDAANNVDYTLNNVNGVYTFVNDDGSGHDLTLSAVCGIEQNKTISGIDVTGTNVLSITTTSIAYELKFDTKEGYITYAGEPGTKERKFNASLLGPNRPEEQNAAISDMDIDFSNLKNYDNGGTSTVVANRGIPDGSTMRGEGKKLGTMTGLSVSGNGKIYGSYSNGNTVLLGQIAVAQFANASGLEEMGDNCYKTTLNSGEFDGIGIDISADGSSMNTGQLEMANVDLSSEFTDMITTQRGFQANSRIITVSDTMLEELINLKR